MQVTFRGLISVLVVVLMVLLAYFLVHEKAEVWCLVCIGALLAIRNLDLVP